MHHVTDMFVDIHTGDPERLDATSFSPAAVPVLEGAASSVLRGIVTAATPPASAKHSHALLQLLEIITRQLCPRFYAIVAVIRGLSLEGQISGVRVLIHLATFMLAAPGGMTVLALLGCLVITTCPHAS